MLTGAIFKTQILLAMKFSFKNLKLMMGNCRQTASPRALSTTFKYHPVSMFGLLSRMQKDKGLDASCTCHVLGACTLDLLVFSLNY